MCNGTEVLSMVGAGATALGQVSQGESSASYGRAQEHLAEADALYAEDAARQQAELILRAASKQKGAARAATGASGARIDEFSLAAENEIERLSQEDAAMTILSGQRQARSLRFGGSMAAMAGKNERSASLFRAGNSLMDGMTGWKGAQSSGLGPTKTVPIYENPEY